VVLFASNVLKIANIKWKGRCATHPMYDPRDDGEGGVRGGCRRCYALLDIYKQHSALLAALREFGTNSERKRPEPARAVDNQPSLFE